jgi:hypothetical protein
MPSLALPFWAVVALALDGLEEAPGRWQSPRRVVRFLPLPLAVAVALLYIQLVFYPVTSAQAQLQQARQAYEMFAVRLQRATQDAARETQAALKWRALAPALDYLARNIVRPLHRAADTDPGDAGPHLELAHWYGELWKLERGNSDAAKEALAQARLAQQFDPYGREGYLAEYRLHLAMAQQARDRAREEYALAARALQGALRSDPTEASLRYLLAEALFKAEAPVEGRHEAEEALRLDRLATARSRELTDRQREQARQWLGLKPNG